MLQLKFNKENITREELNQIEKVVLRIVFLDK